MPTEKGGAASALELIRRWGADAVRDCDGTALPSELLELGLDVYSTICLVRADEEWTRAHPEYWPMKYLSTTPAPAFGETLEIPLLERLHPLKYEIREDRATPSLWQVMDRTGELPVPHGKWVYDPAKKAVRVLGACPGHLYSVSFLATVAWDTTSMYNHLTNGWTRERVRSVDPYYPEVWNYLFEYFDNWLADHPQTTIVRLTSLAYHFNVDFDHDCRDVFRDWTGYQECVSLKALDDFEAQFGYRLTPEDFVDAGRNNATGGVPSARWRDWMSFVQRFVLRFGRELCQRVHRAGKRAAVFHGDHWVGLEPFTDNPTKMGIDLHIGAAEDGVALRRVSDTPGTMAKELRLYPYFFPDVFREGGDPLTESRGDWLKIRRALLRRPIDRIGWGGYPSLALKFPAFCDWIATLCDQFREILDTSGGTPALDIPVRVGVLNAWGTPRAWINSFGRDQKFFEKRTDVVEVAGSNLLECLARLPVSVRFIAMEEIRDGVPSDIDVLINDGDAFTAWSGGDLWGDERIASAVRSFVAKGGGFIGCRGPTADPTSDRFFRLADVLGVDYEDGRGIQNVPVSFSIDRTHSLAASANSANFGIIESFVFPRTSATTVLASAGKHILCSANVYGEGRSVYFASLPYSCSNSRLLLQSLVWAAGRESERIPWMADNPAIDVAFFPTTGRMIAVNSSNDTQSGTITLPDGTERKVSLIPGGQVMA